MDAESKSWLSSDLTDSLGLRFHVSPGTLAIHRTERHATRVKKCEIPSQGVSSAESNAQVEARHMERLRSTKREGLVRRPLVSLGRGAGPWALSSCIFMHLHRRARFESDECVRGNTIPRQLRGGGV